MYFYSITLSIPCIYTIAHLISCIHSHAAECGKGKYAKEISGTYDCTDCPLNQYQPATDELSCIPCGDDRITSSTGAESETECFVRPSCSSAPCPDPKHTCENTDDGRQCSCPSAYDAIGQEECERESFNDLYLCVVENSHIEFIL